MLHILDENRHSAATFLIRAGCDIDSPRRLGPNRSGGDEARDLATPLHLCCQWGIESVVDTLLEHGASINSKVGVSIVEHASLLDSPVKKLKYNFSTDSSSIPELNLHELYHHRMSKAKHLFMQPSRQAINQLWTNFLIKIL